jgi:hypothetical protein
MGRINRAASQRIVQARLPPADAGNDRSRKRLADGKTHRPAKQADADYRYMFGRPRHGRKAYLPANQWSTAGRLVNSLTREFVDWLDYETFDRINDRMGRWLMD